MKASFVFYTYQKSLYLRGYHAYKVHPRALKTCTNRNTANRTECVQIAVGANMASRELLSGKSVLSDN